MQEIIEIADCRLQYSSELGLGLGQCKIQNFDLININKKFRAVETFGDGGLEWK
jgi:hypothetical protein